MYSRPPCSLRQLVQCVRHQHGSSSSVTPGNWRLTSHGSSSSVTTGNWRLTSHRQLCTVTLHHDMVPLHRPPARVYHRPSTAQWPFVGSWRTPVRYTGSSHDDKHPPSDDTRNSGFCYKSFEDYLFDILCDENQTISIPTFLSGLSDTGLRLDDPRLKEFVQRLETYRLEFVRNGSKGLMSLNKEHFQRLVKENIVLIYRAFSNDFIIPDFSRFSHKIDQIYWASRTNAEGKVADYIPQLSRFSPDYWGVSVCTIDGQRHSIGDVSVPFCLQSCSKPLTYALALHELGPDTVHEYVGQEPSGESFNQIKLDTKGKPHNPMINPGAIIVSSLIKNTWKLADRFDYISTQYRRMTGGEYLGFNNSVFLSERETADRNFAIGYYLKENKCFPEGTNLMETMDFYFQMCSVEVTCESGAVIAATLANGGHCPITGEQVLGSEAVRNTLSLMHSCGMYDYSGQFAFKVGLPSKSGVSGAILLVVPNVMGICMWSPPLEETGNSVRGLTFCDELVQKFNFHNYDNLKFTLKKEDPCKRKGEHQSLRLMSLLFGAYNGDLTALRRLALKGADMAQTDYDGRTALHIAAAEGRTDVIEFLLEKCNVHHSPQDRWGHTPLDDAMRFQHDEAVQLLQAFISDVSD